MYTPLNSQGPTVAAIVVAGGAGSRLGGVNKPLLTNSRGTTLLGESLAALQQTFADELLHTVVVGPESLDAEIGRFHNVSRTHEDPPLSGPAAAVAAGAQVLAQRSVAAGTQPSVVVLLAADFIQPHAALAFLRQAILRHHNATLLVPRDGDGHPQWLTSAVSWEQLQRRVNQESPEAMVGQSLRWLLDAQKATFVETPAEAQQGTQDVDSPEDAAQFGITFP